MSAIGNARLLPIIIFRNKYITLTSSNRTHEISRQLLCIIERHPPKRQSR